MGVAQSRTRPKVGVVVERKYVRPCADAISSNSYDPPLTSYKRGHANLNHVGVDERTPAVSFYITTEKTDH